MSKAKVLPPIPQYLSMPFYYATLQTHWVYVPVSAELAEKALAGTGCEPYIFTDHKAVAVINFQRYLSTANSYLGTTNEVEFNLIAYPRSAGDRVASSMTLAQYAYGEDLQKVIGQFRLHVPADNVGAVLAGRDLFGEPKFVSAFATAVPSLNNPPPNSPILKELKDVQPQSPTRWRYTVSTTVEAVGPDGKPEYGPGRSVSPDGKHAYKADKAIYTLEIDVAGLDPIMANASEIVEYGHLVDPSKLKKWPPNDQGFAWTEPHPKPTGLLVGGRWSLYGTYATYFPKKKILSIEYGSAEASPMQIDMRRLVGTRQPVLFQVFESPPAAAESRAFYVNPPR